MKLMFTSTVACSTKRLCVLLEQIPRFPAANVSCSSHNHDCGVQLHLSIYLHYCVSLRASPGSGPRYVFIVIALGAAPSLQFRQSSLVMQNAALPPSLLRLRDPFFLGGGGASLKFIIRKLPAFIGSAKITSSQLHKSRG